MHRITNPDDIRPFIVGGNARFTVKNSQSGARWTYHVKAARNSRGELVSKFDVMTLRGPDNLADYISLGYLPSGASQNYYPLRGHNFSGSTEARSVFEWLWNILHHRNMNGSLRHSTLKHYPHVEFWHSGHCAACGRTLTVPDSILNGFGPVCYHKYRI